MSYPKIQNTFHLFACFLLVLATSCLAGCVTNKADLSVSVTEFEPMPTEAFSKVLIIGLGENMALAGQFESTMVEQLTTFGIETYSIRKLLNKDDEVTKDNAKKVVLELGIDGILVSRLLAKKVDTQTHQTRSEIEVIPDKEEQFSDVFPLGFKRTETKTQSVTLATVVLETKVFSGTTGDKLLRLESLVENQTAPEGVFKESAALIANKLKALGLL
ncbi:hypothetical protein AVL56_19450 [Alteromonas stellipolaris]|uniref:hypothetical protein n=1 Tax=Alteromonas stellipolaris TaxID=233316 RepID=UPI00077024FA|nr:hypothetical protein [Alteromonas stellipolaris]AMJ96274.1 hypothetical protein AVL56_19450 [Alteromonas stellipolaris]